MSQVFPAGGSHLERFAQVFPCVEINTSFYRSHQEKTYRRWAESVPDSFRFSVKMPRAITHELRLQRSADLLRAFLGEVRSLGDKLGCILVQLPPSLALDTKIADGFFSLLRKGTQVPVVCEPRHASWFTDRGVAVLDKARVSLVWAHPTPATIVQPDLGHGMLYLRLHGAPEIYVSAYDDAYIADIASRMQDARKQGREAWCIFDNTARGAAIPNALTLLKQLGDKPRLRGR